MSGIDRRNVLKRLGVGACVVCLPGCSQHAVGSGAEEPTRSPPSRTPATPLGAVSELGAVPKKIMDPLSGDPAFLVKIAGQVSLLSAVCTHAQCVVVWSASDEQFHCPCHRSAFAIDGRVLDGPAPQPLPQLAIHVSKGLVYRD